MLQGTDLPGNTYLESPLLGELFAPYFHNDLRRSLADFSGFPICMLRLSLSCVTQVDRYIGQPSWRQLFMHAYICSAHWLLFGGCPANRPHPPRPDKENPGPLPFPGKRREYRKYVSKLPIKAALQDVNIRAQRAGNTVNMYQICCPRGPKSREYRKYHQSCTPRRQYHGPESWEP